jgi:succinyl-CoA synthetase beta subunit
VKIHEYQAKELFAAYGVSVPRGAVAGSVEEAVQAARSLEGFPAAVKAQILAGGRGKGGGIILARDESQVEESARSLLGRRLVTPQTGARGRTVRTVLVEEGLDIRDELYLSVLPDRSSARMLILGSSAGGVDIEQVAQESPERIVTVYVDPLVGIKPYHCRRLAFGLGIGPQYRKEFLKVVGNLYRLCTQHDCSLVESNPLVLTGEHRVVALDAKVVLDDNALSRHPDVARYRDSSEEDPLEVEAAGYGLNYIKLDGNIGNMVNGAGLAMATMDMIKKAGAEPANFLDVGGGASEEMVENGFRIILSDENVKGILINIFGGILRCDVLAQGVVKAADKVGLNVPVVVRMEGTNVEQGRRILEDSGLDLRTAGDLEDAARQVAAMAREG